MDGMPRWFAFGALALVSLALVAWAVRGPALILDLMWLGCL
jgi:hypothetical protein